MSRCLRLLLGAVGLCACASSPPPAARSTPSPAASPQDAAAADPSYDWHGLLLMPLGAPLRSAPIPLHEVLLFHDSDQPPPTEHASDNRDCYGVDAAAPRLVGQRTDEYVLCFSHDHLARIDASVRLAAADARQTFAQACARWLKGAAAPPDPGAPCAGRDGAVAFTAQLGVPAGEASGETDVQLSMTLTSADGDVVQTAPGTAPGP